MGRVLSAVDIGSNTIHQLVADVDGPVLREIADANEWLNLGEIVAREHEIPKGLQDDLVRCLTVYRKEAKAAKAESWYVFATEAIRKATNAKDVLKRIRDEVGIKIDVIDAQREAELGLRGVLLDSSGADRMILIEIGGGSAQLAHADRGELIWDLNLPLGSGTLVADLGLANPCSSVKVEELVAKVAAEISRGKAPKIDRIIASGGVARGIWRALHRDGEREIAAAELDYLIWSVQRLTLEQIVGRFDVKVRRAATLLPGAVVLRETLRRFGTDTMMVSQYGVREGAILDMAAGKIKSWRI